jgi:hypothetical protein
MMQKEMADEVLAALERERIAEDERVHNKLISAVVDMAWANLQPSSDVEIASIPGFGVKLVPFLVTRKLRETVAGDLEEDFRTFATKWGRPYALKWLCWELGGLFLRRFGPTSIIAGIAMWFRQKFGV